MDFIGYLRRVWGLGRALLIARELAHHDRWPREWVIEHQALGLARLVRHAVARSEFYRELYRGVRLDGDIRLSDLPIIDKRLMMRNFDRFITDPALKRTDLEAHLERLDSDSLYLGRYRVMATAGTSGFRGIFVFSGREWSVELANILRWHQFMGVTPRLRRRFAIGTLSAGKPQHVSARVSESGNVGLFRLLHLPVTLPLDELSSRLDAFRPDVILSYPSVAALLAVEQIAGRIHIAPKVVSTHSERLTDEMKRRIERAWGTTPFDHYGLTEISTLAVECMEHRGLHLLDDLCIVENLDDEYRPVEAGQMGRRLLLTNLYNFTQPLIRYELSDMLMMSSEACPCGRPFPLIARVGGRSEEILYLPGRDGGTVAIPPLVVSSVVEESVDVIEYRIESSADVLTLIVVMDPGAPRERVRAQLAEQIRSQIVALGAQPIRIEVVVRDKGFPRTHVGMGKHRMVTVGAPNS